MKKEHKNLLAPLNGLRVLATLAIFLYHSGILIQGSFPVTFFFMLSGFLLYYTKHDLNNFDTFMQWLGYVWKKLKEFYPLHIVTFVYALIVFVRPFDVATIKTSILNVLLLQAFFEDALYSGNSLSWYLSATIFLYFVGYFLIRIINRYSKYWFFMITITLGLIFICNAMLWMDIPIYLYGNPLYRVLDFFLGMLVSCAFVNSNNESCNERKANIYEILICVSFAALYILSLFIKPKAGYYSILFVIALYLFAQGKGIISQILASSFFQHAAKVCFEFYMIHELVLRTLRLLIPVDTMGHYARVFLLCGIAFIITVMLSFMARGFSQTIGQNIKTNAKR